MAPARGRLLAFLGALGAPLILALVLVAGAPAQAPTAERSCPAGSPAEAKKLAERAAAYLKANGRKAAFRAYRNPAGPFVRGDLYVFAVNATGTIIENVGFPEVIGSGGPRLLAMIGAVREKGRGWVRYRWYNPCTQRMEGKMSYIVRVGDLYVGVGAYGSLSV